MMEKIINMRNQLTCRDIIEIIQLYSGPSFRGGGGGTGGENLKRKEMSQYLRDQSKSFIVEEIDSLNIKEILNLLELFKTDQEFKRYLSYNLKEKLALSPNLPSRDLMSCLAETLEMEDIRGEIIRFALNSEVFYAFPVSYLISLMKKILEVAPYQGYLTTTTPYAPSFRVLPSGATCFAPTETRDDYRDMRDLLKTIQI